MDKSEMLERNIVFQEDKHTYVRRFWKGPSANETRP